MSQSLPMQPGIGYPADGQIELLRKLVWNTWYIAENGGGGGGGMSWVTPPASAASAGTAGQVAYDGSYFYVCQSSGNWTRTPLSSW